MIAGLNEANVSTLGQQYYKYFDYYRPDQTGYEKHLQFHALGTQAKERLFLAANRIGKTFSASMEVCMHLTGYYPEWWTGYRYNRPVNVWAAGVSGKEVYEILEKKYFEGIASELPWIHPSLLVYQNRLNHAYKIRHVSGGVSEIRFKTYDQKREAWQGARVDIIHLDEEPPMNIYSEALMRLMKTREDDYGMMIVTATCLYMSPFVLTFTESVQEVEVLQEDGTLKLEKKAVQVRENERVNGRVFVMAGWDHAPHLDDETKHRYQQTVFPHELEARSKGVPSIGAGMVYPVSEHLITCDPFEIPPHFYRVAGMDFGWKDNTALVFCAIDRDKDIVYVYHEYALNQLTPEQHVFHLSQMRGAEAFRWINIVYDPAGGMSSQKDGESLVSLYRQAGLKMIKANNSREPGVMKILQRMQNGKFKIFKTCHKLLSELRMYARDEEGLIKDGRDHLLDAMRYAVMSGLPYGRTAIQAHQRVDDDDLLPGLGVM